MKHVTVDEVKQMSGEGLVLQGCGGDPAEWLKGINEILSEEGILKNGGAFTDIFIFEHGGLTNIIFPFDNLNPDTLDIGKLAMWRLHNHETFGGTWLSDYLPNQLGVYADDLGAEVGQGDKGAQGIPAEFPVFTNPHEAARPLLKFSDVGIAEALVKMHAACNDSMYVASSLKTLEAKGGKEFLISTNNFGVRVFEAIDVYKIGSAASKIFTPEENPDQINPPDHVFAVIVYSSTKGDINSIRGDMVELNPKALLENIIRHGELPNAINMEQPDGSCKKYDLLSWFGLPDKEQRGLSEKSLLYPEGWEGAARSRFGDLVRNSAGNCKMSSIGDLLSCINEGFMAQAENPQPDMLRLDNTDAREILLRGDAHVYKLTSEGPERLTLNEALNPMCFNQNRDVAIKVKDACHLDKWAQGVAINISKSIARVENNKQKDHSL